MSHCRSSVPFKNSPKPHETELEYLLDENHRLKQQMRISEGKHVSNQAFLEQKIECLQDQINSYRDREDNIKRSNQTIMKTLEDLDTDASKNVLKVKAIEELEKASQHYNQSLTDMKVRMREEIAKLASQNKELEKNAIEKDCKLKVLTEFIEDIKTDYRSLKPIIMMNNSKSSPQNSNRESYDEKGFHRRSTLPVYFGGYDQEYNSVPSEKSNERDRKGTGLTDRADLIVIEEETNLPNFTGNKPKKSLGKELSSNYSHTESTSRGCLSSNPLSPREGDIARRIFTSITDTDVRESIAGSANLTPRSVIPHHVNHFAPPQYKTDNPYAFEETKGPSVKKEVKEAKTGKQLIIKNFDIVRKQAMPVDMQPTSCTSKGTEGFYSARENVNRRYGNEDRSPTGLTRDSREKIKIRDLSGNNGHNVLVERRGSNKDNTELKGNKSSRQNTARTKGECVTERGDLYHKGAENDQLRGEMKFMMGRLLKVKDKLDKKNSRPYR